MLLSLTLRWKLMRRISEPKELVHYVSRGAIVLVRGPVWFLFARYSSLLRCSVWVSSTVSTLPGRRLNGGLLVIALGTVSALRRFLSLIT